MIDDIKMSFDAQKSLVSNKLNDKLIHDAIKHLLEIEWNDQSSFHKRKAIKGKCEWCSETLRLLNELNNEELNNVANNQSVNNSF